MSHFIKINLPITNDDLEAVQRLLRKAQVFCTAFKHTGEDPYDVTTYHLQAKLHDTEWYLLMDRNMFSRVVRLASGGSIDESMRVPAGVMAFSQCADIQIEPNLALYEYASHAGAGLSIEELAIFRSADNLHPSWYTDVALGRTQTIHPVRPKTVDRTTLSGVLSKSLNDWRFAYTTLLKLAVLASTSKGPSLMVFERLLEWIFWEFFFDRVSFRFASLYLSPKRRRNMLKQLWSPDRQAALAGVRNAAWDLTVVRQWFRKLDEQERENRIWVLCSSDSVLRKVAEDLLAGDTHPELAVRCLLDEDWGARAGEQLARKYFEYMNMIADPARVANRNFSGSEANALITSLEQELLSLPGVSG